MKEEEIVPLDFYRVVVVSESDNTETKELTTNLLKAKRDFDLEDEKGATVILEKIVYLFRFVGDTEEYGETPETYPLEEYYDDDTIWEKVKELDPEEISVKVVKTEAEEREEDIDAAVIVKKLVGDYFKSMYNYQLAGYAQDSAYFMVNIDEKSIIELRISDHSLNPKNISDKDYIVIDSEVVYNKYEKPSGIDPSGEGVKVIYNERGGYTIYLKTIPKPERSYLISVVIHGGNNPTKDKYKNVMLDEEDNKFSFMELEFFVSRDDDEEDKSVEIIGEIEDALDDIKKLWI